METPLLLLFYLLLTWTWPDAVFTKSQELVNTKNDKSCNGFVVPGIDIMIHGVDITKLDLMPYNNKVSDGILHQVIALTCNKGNVWVYEGKTYQLPDQFERPYADARVTEIITSDVSIDSGDYKRTIGLEKSGSVDLVDLGTFSSSVGFKNVEESIYNNQSTFALVSLSLRFIVYQNEYFLFLA